MAWAAALAAAVAVLVPLTLAPSASTVPPVPAFLADLLGPSESTAPLVRRPAEGVRVELTPAGYDVSHEGASVGLAGEVRGTSPWQSFAGGVSRETPFGLETITVEPGKTEQYLTVTERQGPQTWRWKLTTGSLAPRIGGDGAIHFFAGTQPAELRIAPVAILDAGGQDVTPDDLRWSLAHDRGVWWLELTLDDANLPLPYVIDPAVDYPSPLYLSSTNAAVTGSWKLIDAVPLLGDASTRNSLCKNCVGYVQWKPGIDNGVSVSPTSTPTGSGWIVDAAGATGFPAGNWSFTVETDIPDLLLAPGQAILAVGVWKGTVSGGVFSPTQTLLPPTDDPAAQDLRTSVVPVATTVTYSLPEFSLASGETLYVEYWRKQVVGINDTNLARRYLDFIVNDGVANIAHPTADDVAPTHALSVTEGTGPDVQYFDPGTGTLYYNPAAPGNFTLSDALADSGSEPYSVAFPALAATGFTHAAITDTAAPFQSNVYSFDPTSTAAPPAQTITGADNALNTSTATLSFVRDTTPPSGGSVSYPDGADADGVVLVATETGSDAEAGLSGSALLERQTATFSAGTCGAFGAWSAVISPDLVPAGTCARYRYRVWDRVANEVVYTSPNVVTVGSDSTPPSVPVLTLSESQADEHAVGTTLFYNPSGGNAGSFTVEAATTDLESGINRVDFPAIFGLDGSSDIASPYQATYAWTSLATASGANAVTAVNESGLTSSSSFTVSPDTEAPSTSVSAPAAGDAVRNGTEVSAGASDALAGVAQVEFGYCPGATCSWLVATPIGTDATAPYSVTWNDQPDDGDYTLLAAATDHVGNGVVSLPVPVGVDNTAPSVLLAVEEENRADLQYFDPAGATLYYNPAAAADLRLGADASDETGVQSVAFPPVSTVGFTGAAATDGLAPYESNSYSFDATNVSPPAPTAVVVTDLAGNTDSAELIFVRDTDPPSAGELSYLDGYDADGSIVIATTDGTDSAAGVDVDSRFLERQTAPLADGSCGLFGGWTAVDSPDTVPSGSCARYRHTVSDRVGNAVTVTSSNVVKVDLSAPVAPVLTLFESEPDEHIDGTTLYYNPRDANAGTFSVAAATDDSESTVATVSFAAVFGLDGATATTPPYEASYSWTATATASGAMAVSATNAAGLTASATFTVTPDTIGPDVSFFAPADGAAVREGQAVEAAAFDALAGTAEVEFRYCPGSACSWDLATPLGSDGSAPYSAAWNAQPADGTYTLVARAVDNVGNLAEAAPITVTVDNTAPSNLVVPAETFGQDLQHFEDATDTLYYNPEAGGGFVLSSAADDAGSGVARVDFPRISVTGFRGAAASDGLAPFTSNTYSFDDANAVAPGDAAIVVTDVAGNQTNETISFERDTAPPAGGSVSYPGGFQATGSVDVGTANGTDAGVGIDPASAHIERQLAVLAGGVCGAYGPWEPALSPDSLPDATCARYRYRVSDRVGNEAVYASADEVQTDFTPPTAALVDPGTVLSGTVDLAADAGDDASGIASLTFQVSPAGANQWSDIAAGWDTTAIADGPYDLRVVATDRAGNSTVSAALEGRIVDNTAPSIEITAAAGYLNASSADPYPLAATSMDGDVGSIEFFRCDDASVDCATGGWLSLGMDTSAPFVASWSLDPDGNRALRAVAVDAVGKATSTVVNVTIDRQAPSNGALAASHAVSTWSRDNTVDITLPAATDAVSGVDGFSYQWDGDPAGTPDLVKDAEEAGGGTTSPPLADGAWYFHLRTADNAGNWSDTLHAGPFLVDANASTAVAMGGSSLLRPFNLRRTLPVAWTGGDGASGIGSYDVQYRAAAYAGAFGAPVLWQSATTATSAFFTGSPGSTYCFSGRAVDVAGNPSPWSSERCTALPLNNASLASSRGWSKRTGRGHYLNSYSVSSRRGASLTRTGVLTRRIAVVVTKCAACGTLGIYWNGNLLKKLSLAAVSTRKKQLVSIASFAAPRSGTVKLVVLSSGRPVIVEGVGVSVS